MDDGKQEAETRASWVYQAGLAPGVTRPNVALPQGIAAASPALPAGPALLKKSTSDVTRSTWK